MPGDNILGFVTRGGGGQRAPHRLHQRDVAATAVRTHHRGALAPSPSSVFLVAIQVEALDRHRLLSDVTRVLADEKVNILSRR